MTDTVTKSLQAKLMLNVVIRCTMRVLRSPSEYISLKISFQISLIFLHILNNLSIDPFINVIVTGIVFMHIDLGIVHD